MRLFLIFTMTLISFLVLEGARRSVDITSIQVGQTPVVHYATAEADGPIVVVAHGFAGSQQMMQGYALPLARAGYRVYAFDFLGHGRHPDAMSGDVSSIDGTTRLLVEQVTQVLDAVGGDTRPIALLGHSMATDILVRAAAARDDIGPIILVSAFSTEIDALTPNNLLLLTGAWETKLRRFAREAVQMVDPGAGEGDIAMIGDVSRRSVVAPFSEHVSVLQNRVARRAALAWLDRAYERTSDVTIWPTGWAILGLFAGLVMMMRPISRLAPRRAPSTASLSNGQTAIVLLVPMVVAPISSILLDSDVLPVLVANYLVLHLLVFGGLQLALLRLWRVPFGRLSLPALAILLAACATFGVALDRYTANFWPTPGRFWIVSAMTIGAVPYMLADAVLTSTQSFLRRLLTRISFLASLGIAVALDFEDLFFLILIGPVMVLFYLIFGTMGRHLSKRVGPLPSGLALGVMLAWALGVSFPIFQG